MRWHRKRRLVVLIPRRRHVFSLPQGASYENTDEFLKHMPQTTAGGGKQSNACDNRIRSNQIRRGQKQYRCDLPLRWCSTEWGRSVRPGQAEHEGEQNEKKIWLAKLKTEMTSLFSSCCWRDISLHFVQPQSSNGKKLTCANWQLRYLR